MKWSKIFLWITVCIIALSNVNSAEAFSGGSGTAESPYQISTLEDLLAINNQTGSVNYVLVNDIDLANYTFDHSVIDELHRYAIFDGDYHTISNITIYAPESDDIGFIGFASSDTIIKNLILTNVDITGENGVGGLCGGTSDFGIDIICCSVSGSVVGNNSVGGLCGFADSNGYIYDYMSQFIVSIDHDNMARISGSCTNVSVTGNSSVGGLCGYINGYISDSYSTGEVTGSICCGGFCGNNWYDNSIRNCYSDSIINVIKTEDTQYIGGFIGYKAPEWRSNDGTIYPAARISSCYCNYDKLPTDGSVDTSYSVFSSLMMNVDTFTSAGWDFSNEDGDPAIWRIFSGVDTPRLVWQLMIASDPYFADGSGTADDPYQLSGSNDISNFINNLDSSYADKCFILTVDIDMSANVFYNHGFDYPFSGTFDGNDHTISNLTIRNLSVEDAFICSLTPTGVIKNLVLDNIYVSNINGGYFSTLCSINNGHIKHCAVTGEVYTQGYNVDCPLISSGGLCALNGGLIEQCYTNVLAQNVSVYGGICGLNYTSIDQCYSVGQIIPDNLYFPANVYGIADGGPVTNSFWDIETTGTTEGHGTGLSTVLMTTQSTFTDAGWDFVGETANGTDDIWVMNYYPVFKWHIVKVPDVTNMYLQDAKDVLLNNGFGVSNITFVIANDVPNYTVLSAAINSDGCNVDLRVSISSQLDGSGTEADPLQIFSPEDLVYISTCDSNAYCGQYLILTNDIDLNGYSFTKSVFSACLDGNVDTDAIPFSGSFDGNGHSITNLSINTDDSGCFGLFGKIDKNGIVKNLALNNISISRNSTEYGGVGIGQGVGGICGYLSGQITQCYVSGAISTLGNSGGICGINHGGTIQQCYSDCVISCVGTDFVFGGLCARVEEHGNINDCVSAGSIIGGVCVGGFCGSIDSGFITNSYSITKISNTSSGTDGFCSLYNYNYIFYNLYPINNCFWNIETSVVDHDRTDTYITSTQMSLESTFTSAGWDFAGETANGTDDIWTMNYYPTLSFLSFMSSDLLSEVPDYSGMTLTQAQEAITAAGFTVGNITKHYSQESNENSVVGQFPSPGTEYFYGNNLVIELDYSVLLSYPGSGTEIDPYQLSSAEDLIVLGDPNNSYHDKHFVLTADIDLSAYLFDAAVIAGGDGVRTIEPFGGTFDGNGFSIKNMSISSNYNNIGLFGSLSDSAKVTNLKVVTANITGSGIVGIICGDCDGIIQNCYSSGTISAHNFAGGIAGVLSGSISGTYSDTTVIGNDNIIGGFVGQVNSGFVSDCYVAGSVAGYAYVGGFYGENYYGEVCNCYADAIVSGESTPAGGFGGGAQSAVVKNCYWNIDTAGVTTSYGGSSITDSNLHNMQYFINAGWDFWDEYTNETDYIWYMDDTPRLFWSMDSFIEVPDLVALPFDLAADSLATAGFSYSCDYVFDSSMPAGMILSQQPEFGNSWPSGAIVRVSISVGEKYSGSGTESEPYLISSPKDILGLNSCTADYDKYFILTTDIDLSGYYLDSALIAKDIYPDDNYDGTPFAGQFDGNGFTISNLTIAGTSNYTGLFGMIADDAVVSDLKLENVDISGNDYVGAVCGYTYGDIYRCSSSGTVSGNNSVGGFCGKTHGKWSSNVMDYYSRDCFDYNNIGYSSSTCNVSGFSSVGGFCGSTMVGCIYRCYASGSVTGDSYYAGFCGFADGYNFVEYDYIGTYLVECDIVTIIRDCYSTSTIISDVNATMPGTGFCAYAFKEESDMWDPGYNGMHDCFWDMDASGCTLDVCATGLSTSQMYDKSIYTSDGWDFNDPAEDPNTWQIRDGFDYPHLTWQVPTPGDIAGSWAVDMADLEAMSAKWLVPDDPQSADLLDFAELAENWLKH